MTPPTPQQGLQTLMLEAAREADDSAAVKIMLHGILIGMVDIHDRIDGLTEEMRAVNAAFPDGPENHCRAHEALIERNNMLRKLTYAVTEKSLALLFWAGLSWLGLAAWTYFRGNLK